MNDSRRYENLLVAIMFFTWWIHVIGGRISSRVFDNSKPASGSVAFSPEGGKKSIRGLTSTSIRA